MPDMENPTLPPPPPLRYRVFLALYVALIFVSKPLIWRYFKRRAKSDPEYGASLEERKGFGQPFAADVWVHAVSLGELKSAVPLIQLCLDAGHKVITTHATPAGRKAAEEIFAADIVAENMCVRYAPIDVPGYWGRFFKSYRPNVGLVMEMEFWPVMLEQASRHSCLLWLANSQIPSKTFKRATTTAKLFGHPVSRAAGVFAKSEVMAKRFRAFGAQQVIVVGETRFDIARPDTQIVAGRDLGGTRRVVTLASVVAGEEEVYLSLAQSLAKADSPPLVVWVPRAPEVFQATADRLSAAGLRVAKRSDVFDDTLQPRSPLDEIDVLVGDSLGEMFFYLAPADAVIVGGGFVEKGAHNVIEPLSLGKPVLTGPHVWTIEFPGVEAEAAGVLTVVRSPEDLLPLVQNAIGQDNDHAVAFHRQYQGASRRIFEAIQPVLEEK